MNEFRVFLKNGMRIHAESKYIDIMTIHSMLNEHQPFMQIGDKVFAKDTIAMIEKIEKTEKEN